MKINNIFLRKDLGIGVDIENINRFNNLNHIKNNEFLNKIFTKREQEYCYSRKNTASHLAVRFAGKEAVIKAFYNLGIRAPSYNNIEIINDRRNVPFVNLNKKDFRYLMVKVSLSHCEDKALAFAVLYYKKNLLQKNKRKKLEEVKLNSSTS